MESEARMPKLTPVFHTKTNLRKPGKTTTALAVMRLARELLADDARREALRARIREGFAAQADPRRWAAALEAAFHDLHHRRLAGEAPTPLDLSADTSGR